MVKSKDKTLELENIFVPLEKMEFHSDLLDLWKNKKNYSILVDSESSDFIKGILIDKVKIRTNRFFGEAYVALQIPMVQGWYSSYRWLNWKGREGGLWITGEGLKQGENESRNYKKMFYNQFILEIVGVKNLLYLHEHSKIFQNGDPKTKKYPKAPDLSIIDKKGNLIFIEVKLPNDKFDPLQEVGLKMIKKYLRTKNNNPIVVKKVKLIPI
jgi:hypothetical protein